MQDDKKYMKAALEEAKQAAARDEVPVGAVLVEPETGDIVAYAGNMTCEMNDPTAHAEMQIIRVACKMNMAQRIPGYDMYVTLEPCTMCAGAISFARIRRLVIGAEDPKGGGVLYGAKFFDQPTCHHRPEVTSGIMAEECGQILKDYFKGKR